MNKGFTLVETLVVALLFLIIMMGVTKFERDTFYDSSFQSGSFTSVQNAEEILRVMAGSIRSASQGSDGSYPILTAASGTFTFFSDIYGNGVKERVRYFISGTNLEEGIMVPKGTPLSYASSTETVTGIAADVQNLSSSTDLFDYYNNTYTGTSSALTQPVSVSAISLVKINLVLDANTKMAPGPVTYTTQITLRNLKTNL